MTDTNITIELTARIREADELVLEATVGGDTLTNPTLENLRTEHHDAKRITLRVNDFYHEHTVYEVYGIVLRTESRTIDDYWHEEPAGAAYTFVMPESSHDPLPRFIVGARPRRPGKTEPTPNAPGGPLPEGTDNPGGGGGVSDSEG